MHLVPYRLRSYVVCCACPDADMYAVYAAVAALPFTGTVLNELERHR
jgi:hypothetical protein